MFAATRQGQEMIEQARLRREELEQVVHNALQPDTDYMMMENRKFCLLKAGAEKLCDYFGYTVQYELVQSSSSHMNDQVMYVVKAILKDSIGQQTIAEGLGLASSLESRYESQNSMDVANTILKIAKKRAMVDAVITAVGGSFLFTQDMEDKKSDRQQVKQNTDSNRYRYDSQNGQKSQNTGYGKSNGRSYSNQNKNGRTGYPSKSGSSSSGKTGVTATESQINYIEKLVSKLRVNRQQLCAVLQEQFGTDDYRKLTKQQASEFIQQLKEQSSQAS